MRPDQTHKHTRYHDYQRDMLHSEEDVNATARGTLAVRSSSVSLALHNLTGAHIRIHTTRCQLDIPYHAAE